MAYPATVWTKENAHSRMQLPVFKHYIALSQNPLHPKEAQWTTGSCYQNSGDSSKLQRKKHAMKLWTHYIWNENDYSISVLLSQT